MADNKVNSGLLEFSEDQKVFVALDAETGEVQKAVTIDGDGVETDIQGVQPSGKKEITSTAEVNVASYATAQVVDEDLVAGNIKKDVDILGVVGSYEGEPDMFALAEVTIVNNDSNGIGLLGGIEGNSEGYGFLKLSVGAYLISTNEGAAPNSSKTVQAILMPANNEMQANYLISTNGTPTVAGDAVLESTEDGYILTVKGDCTLTISPAL